MPNMRFLKVDGNTLLALYPNCDDIGYINANDLLIITSLTEIQKIKLKRLLNHKVSDIQLRLTLKDGRKICDFIRTKTRF